MDVKAAPSIFPRKGLEEPLLRRDMRWVQRGKKRTDFCVRSWVIDGEDA